MALSKPKCFGNLTLHEIEEKQKELQNPNTTNNEKKAVRAFKNYLAEQGLEDIDFFYYTESELDKHLRTFWFNTKKN